MCCLPAQMDINVHVHRMYRSCLKTLLLAFSSREIILSVYIDFTARIIYNNYSITSGKEKMG